MMRGLLNWTFGVVTCLVLVLSACTKEAPVGPCSHDDPSGTEKRGGEGGWSDPSASSGDEGSDPTFDSELEEDGISDDGDDEADNERNKKKPIATN
ncbi:MAG: hypothetical protein IPH53_06985 [Flavobacteriales bacterium]|jgi:hypothetical protein|nr:hypothetical protein [Flavobacteriales bacterium]MBK7084410.1 hypothetical protein [Flavobacteriales bacterium]MBK7270380.1 hypothetical protein [Flavobacteriales bacterium]MBK7751380.1 hypothetical protein [Flavobacteriales bacterium]MBK9073721.1 hypothetical protein [Flavobacteriales bacterium]